MGTFIKFLTDDPIMLGLCIAIVVLIIAFVVVLILGKRKDDKNSRLNNTSELLKTEINLEALDSTREYTASEIKPKEEPVVKVASSNPEVTSTETPTMEVPVETKTEPTKLEVEAPKNEEITKNEIPEIFTFGVDGAKKTEEPVNSLSGFPAPDEFKTEPIPSIVESKVEPVETEDSASNIEDSNKDTPTFPTIGDNSIIESKVNPINDNDFHGADSLIDFTTPEEQVVETPQDKKEEQSFESFNFGFNSEEETSNIFDNQEPTTVGTPVVASEPVLENNQEPINDSIKEIDIVDPTKEGIFDNTVVFPKVESQNEETTKEIESKDNNIAEVEPYNSIYMNTQNIELPDIKISDFSKTAIMRHIPIMESMPNNLDNINLENTKNTDTINENSELDDVDLPKLNPSETTDSAFKSLQGESFNIEN